MIMYCFHHKSPINFTIIKDLQMIDPKFAFRSMIDSSSFDRSDRSFSRIVWPLTARVSDAQYNCCSSYIMIFIKSFARMYEKSFWWRFFIDSKNITVDNDIFQDFIHIIFISQVEVAKASMKRLKTLRHPNITTFLDGLEVSLLSTCSQNNRRCWQVIFIVCTLWCVADWMRQELIASSACCSNLSD